jgi:predicted DCC family thiol-disulfide oxidoreductase YuxK
MQTPKPDILLVYDDECPACDNYCRMVRIRETVGTLKLVNARESSEVMQEITRQGLDIDQGMVLKVGDVLYYGSDAIHALSLMGSPSGVFNRLNHWLFRSKRRARLLYPLLRSCRNLLLKVLRKTKINNLGLQGNDRF